MGIGPPPPILMRDTLNFGMSSYVFKLKTLYPNFIRFRTENVIDIVEEVCPFTLETYEVPFPAPHFELTKRSRRLFKTYMFIMKEYHELWDL